MQNRRCGLLFKFSIIFGFFTFISLILSGVMNYANQMKAYKRQCLENVRNIGDYLEKMIQASKEEFIVYQKYFMEHSSEAKVPFNFTEYHTAQRKYEKMLAEANITIEPGKPFDFDSFPEDVKMAYFIYVHEYWLLAFENARKAFNLPYTYYLVPKADIYDMVYMIDGERTPKDVFGNKAKKGCYLYLGDEYYDPYEKCKVQWDTWFTGECQNDFQVWDNEWGHTYAYYTPLIINNQKLGLIGTEVQVADVNETILRNTLIQTISIALILVVSISLMLVFINFRYINKIVRLQKNLIAYSNEKNPDIASKIEDEIHGNDEISQLARYFAALILKIEDYIRSLFDTSQKLKVTQERAEKMDALANRDSLTGVRNKTAYDNEIRRLEWKVAEGKAVFAIAMIDLNFLKQINDNFGHEHGNAAIKKLCSLVCQIFKHSPVFRIGGDEFVVILEREDYKNLNDLRMSFNIQIEVISKNPDYEPWERISAALGIAVFDRSIDSSVQNVFDRADKAMYTRKKEMKAIREI